MKLQLYVIQAYVHVVLHQLQIQLWLRIWVVSPWLEHWSVLRAGDESDQHPDLAEAAQKVQESLDSSTATVGGSEQEAAERRHRVRDLFYAMDKDGNGKLDVAEFRGTSALHHSIVLCTRALSCNTVLQVGSVQLKNA